MRRLAALVIVLATWATACTTSSNRSSLDSLEEQLTVEIDEFMAAGGIPGLSFAVVTSDGELLTIARGTADLTTDEPLDVDDYFRLGSITKPVTATVMLQLVDEGLVGLDTPVSSYLDSWAPGYEYEDEVTIRQLLDHTSGFFEYPFDPGFYAYVAPRLDEALTPEELLAFSAERGAQFELGTQRRYSTVGYVAAGLVIEAVTGHPVEEEFAARIYEPLGLDDVYLAPRETPPREVVHGYATGLLASAIEAFGLVPDDGVIQVDDTVYVDMSSIPQEVLRSVGWTGGGLEAQLDDTARLFGGLFSDELVPPSLLAQMLAPTLDSTYGLGVNVETVAGETVYSHGGAVPGFRSYAGYLPDYGIAFAFSASATPIDPDVDELAEAAVKLLTGSTPIR